MTVAVVRPMYPWEIEAVVRLIGQCLTDDPADLLEFRSDLCRGALCFVACTGTQIVGAATVARSFAASGIWELGWCVVAEDGRRQGIGSALIRAREDYAVSQGARMLLLSSGEVDYHTRRGFRVVAESAEDVLMARIITPPEPDPRFPG